MQRRLIVVPLIRRAEGPDFDAFAWVAPKEFDRYDMNEETA